MKATKSTAYFIVAGLMSALVLVLPACTKNYPPLEGGPPPVLTSPNYIIGAGDSVEIFVWRNVELSAGVTVRPDGKITTPLIEDVPASGKTPTQLARDMEKELEVYVKNPVVTVMVNGFAGPYSEQIRVVGQASNPQALPYRDQMSLLDLMIAVGGLTEFADGNESKVVRVVDGNWQEFGVRIDDLINGADISANVYMLPGDILIIPESWF
ncbi:MAG: polysaccharide export protein [Gammaproteobacteria bacterium]|nr:MAG: polysaccharide export protein [Gammaproteobacteria bacterium]